MVLNKIYYLSTCDTCKRILKELDLLEGVDLQDIKKNPITESELDFLKNTIGSYEKLFNKRSQLYKQRNLKDRNLTENDYRNLILEHYTFLIRPVIVVDNQIFAGNSPKVILEVKNKLQSLHNQ
ncbi:arsenate reductase [Capnocytophaga cynodegmi]|nr:arsenate reductase [Capnocytophaga cynodegmi]